jgi:hypothetical protein
MFPTCDATMINNRNEKKKPQSVGETIQCQNEKGQQWTTKRQNENIFATRTLQKSGGYHMLNIHSIHFQTLSYGLMLLEP